METDRSVFTKDESDSAGSYANSLQSDVNQCQSGSNRCQSNAAHLASLGHQSIADALSINNLLPSSANFKIYHQSRATPSTLYRFADPIIDRFANPIQICQSNANPVPISPNITDTSVRCQSRSNLPINYNSGTPIPRLCQSADP